MKVVYTTDRPTQFGGWNDIVKSSPFALTAPICEATTEETRGVIDTRESSLRAPRADRTCFANSSMSRPMGIFMLFSLTMVQSLPTPFWARGAAC